MLAALIVGSPWPAGFRTIGRAALELPAIPNNIYGLGARLGADGDYPKVDLIVVGGAAEHEGHLKAGDHIAGVAQGDAHFVDCKGMVFHDIVKMTRGKEGSIVRLQVIPAGETDPTKREVISVARAAIYKPGLSPDDQAKLSVEAGKMMEMLRKVMTEDMQTRVEEVIRATAIQESGSNALETSAAGAVDQSLQKSMSYLGDYWVEEFIQNPPEGRQALFRQMDSQTAANDETWAREFEKQAEAYPADQPAWKEGLKQTLTPAQAAAWDGAEAKRLEAAKAEIDDFLKGLAQFASGQGRPLIKQMISRIELDLNLPKDRQDKLDATGETLLGQYGEKTRAAAEKQLLALRDEDRKATINQKQQGFYNWATAVPETEWDTALMKMLTPDETKRLQTAKEDREKGQAQAVGKLMVALLDDKVAFTAAQRGQLEPIAERLAKELSGGVLGNGNGFSRGEFYGAAQEASDDELKAILDPSQCQRWRALSALRNVQDNMYIENSFPLPTEADASKPQPAPEPEATENAISDYLAEQAATERATVLAESLVMAEDAARVAHLPPDVAERLKTAARGSAEYYLNLQELNVEATVRSAVGDASPDTVKQRLGSIQNYQFRDNFTRGGAVLSSNAPEWEVVWNKAVKANLNPDQTKAWQQEMDARSAYQANAIAGLVVWAFSQKVSLSRDQTAKLEPMVTKVLAEYGPDIGSYFASNGLWYLQGYSMYLPIAGIPEKDLEGLLSKEQLESWNGSEERGNAGSYWTNIAQNHAQRRGNSGLGGARF